MVNIRKGGGHFKKSDLFLILAVIFAILAFVSMFIALNALYSYTGDPTRQNAMNFGIASWAGMVVSWLTSGWFSYKEGKRK